VKFKDRPTRDDLAGVTIFTVPSKIGSDVSVASNPFTESPYMNEVNNEPGRTLNGEPIPPVKQKDEPMVEQFGTESNKALTRKFNEHGVENPPFDSKHADLLRDLPKGDGGKSFGDGFDWQKQRLNGT
jgi:hypothetical protein